MSKHATSKSRAAKGASHDDAPGAKEASGKMILQHGESNNWLPFKEWAIDHFGAKYGKKVRHILQHGKRVPETPFPPRPVDTRATGGSLGGGGKAKAKPSKKGSGGGVSSDDEYESAAEEELDFETQLEIWKTTVTTLTKLRTEHAEKDADIDTKVYSELMLLLSADSRDKVKSVKGFQVWHDSQDPVKLWLALQKTHECNVTGVQRIDETTAETNFITLKQGPESLVEYKVTFDQARKTLEHTSYGAVDEKRAAMRFLMSLDMNRFARLVCDVQNRAFHDAGSLPQTFEEAYVLATNYKDVRIEGASVTVGNAQSFYAGKVGGGGGGDRQKKKGKGDKGKGGKSESDKPQGQGKHGKHGKQSESKDGKPKQGNSDKHAGAKDHGQAKQPNCHTCGADDHWAAKCPHKEAAQKAIAKAKAGDGEARSSFYTNHQQQQPNATAYAGQQEPFDSQLERLIAGSFVIKATSSYGEHEQQCFMARKSDVLMDCGSSVSIMADESLVSNIRKARVPCELHGISKNAALYVDEEAEWEGITVYFSQDAPTNLLSLAHLEDVCNEHGKLAKIDYTSQRRSFHLVRKDGRRDVFQRTTDRLYKLVTQQKHAREDEVYVTTDEVAALFPKREQDAAVAARQLERNLGYPSEKDLTNGISSGAITGSGITVKDVRNAKTIFGPDPHKLQGAMTRRAQKMHLSQPTSVASMREQRMIADVFFVDGFAFVVSISKPMDLVLVKSIASRHGKGIAEAIIEQANHYKSHGYDIVEIVFDSEAENSAIRSLIESAGYKLTTVPSGHHASEVERAIRLIKERVRAMQASVRFPLFGTLLLYAVIHAVRCINFFPSSTTPHAPSPIEQLKGVKMDVTRDAYAAFGDYVMVLATNTSELAWKSLASRAHGAIVLTLLGDKAGTARLLDLETWQVIDRNRVQPMPTPPAVVALIALKAQERADATRKQVGAVSFSNRGGLLLDAATPVEKASTPPRILERALGDAPTYVQTPQLQSGQAIHREITIEKAGVPLRAGERVANQGGVQAHVEMPHQANQGGVIAASAGSWQADLPAAPINTNKASSKPMAKPSKGLLEPAPPSAVQSRVSGRTIKAPEWKSMVASTSMFDELACHEGGLNVFYTLNKALREGGAEADAGEEATEKELRQLFQEAEAIIPIDASKLTREQRKTAMRGQLILKKKYKASGEFDKTKARFVANGSTQPGHLYEGQTSAPTAALSSQFAIISIAAGEKRKVRIYDIKGAYLQADMPDHPNGHPHYVILDRLVASRFVKIYPKFQNLVGEDGTLWMKIKKALYGCKQSGQLWYKLLTKTLADAGFVANRYDPCIMNKTCNGTQLTVIFHVDDLHVSSVSNELLDRFEKFLHRSFPEVTSRKGPILDYLGMVLDYSVEGECHVAMPGFMDELLEGIEGKAATPATDTLFKVREDAELLGPKEQAELHTIVAQLLYLTKHTRPDIMVPVAFLTTRVQKATVDDKAKLDRILKYLNGTREEGITLSMDPKNPSVRACIDAAYACHEDMQSHTGMTITLGKGPIFAKSTKQKLVSRSSTEAEQIALSDGAGLAIWINKLLQDQGYRMPPAIVYQDNKSTIHLANNGRSTSEKTRHIDVRYFWIKDRIDKGEVRIEYLPTAEMTADVLTKPITGALYQRLKDKLMNGH